MKRIVVAFLAVAFVAVCAFGVVAGEKGEATYTFDTKMGAVTFPHADHQAKVGDCKTCHHEGVEAGACRTCHDGTKAPKFKDAAHKLCKDCHKEKGGPTNCKDCHKK